LHYLAGMIWRTKEIGWHVAFWLGYLTLRISVIQLYPGDFWFRVGVELLEIPVKAFALYTVIFFLVERLLLKRAFVFFSLTFAVFVFIVMWLNRIEDYYMIYPLTHSEYIKYDLGFFHWRTAFINLIYIYPVVGIGATIHFVRSWITNHWAKERLAREKAEIELKVLKDQIHPHFLFNSMNNIYSLALSKSEKTPEMMLRLSKLLSYMVYDANLPFVPLAKEVQALNDYVELEKLRLSERLLINFNTTGLVEQFTIAPLLLFPLLENCFKHGSHQTSEPIWIYFNLHVQKDQLTVQIENNLPPQRQPPDPNTAGVGIRNVKKRLELIYPNHELRIHSTDTYLVYLKIKNHGEMHDRRR
jgi:two-component system, LytTR family, sensor kinase